MVERQLLALEVPGSIPGPAISTHEKKKSVSAHPGIDTKYPKVKVSRAHGRPKGSSAITAQRGRSYRSCQNDLSRGCAGPCENT